jgi:hypothetical protein
MSRCARPQLFSFWESRLQKALHLAGVLQGSQAKKSNKTNPMKNKNSACQNQKTGVQSRAFGKTTYVTQIKNRFAASAAVHYETGISLNGHIRGTPTSGVPENVPLRARQCLWWGVSRSRLFS